MDNNHPDPFQDAMQLGLQRAVQLGSCALTAAQVYLYQQRSHTRTAAERDDKAKRALTAQIRAEHEASRARWAPALDPGWLSHATFVQTATAWGAAMPYADRAVPWYQPAAATALRKCEERLRDLHPYAMARYDRLRADGMNPADAMREAAPFFARPSHVRDAPTKPRPALSAGNGQAPWAADPEPAPPTPTVETEVLERRGRQILGALHDRAREQGRPPLSGSHQRTVLETITSLPPEIIDRIVPPDTSAGLAQSLGDRAGAADRARAADLDAATDLAATPRTDGRTVGLDRARDGAATASAARAQAARTGRPWEQDFPYSICEVVATTTRTSTVAAAIPGATRVPAQKQAGHGCAAMSVGGCPADSPPGAASLSSAQAKAIFVRLNAIAERFFCDRLHNSWVPAYLETRGFDRDAQGRWHAGYAPAEWDTLTRHLRTHGCPGNLIEAAGLARRSQRGTLTDTFRDRAVLPIRSPNGTVAGFGRASDSATLRVPKYINSPRTCLYDKSAALYGISEARAALSMGARPVIVEGPFDAIAVTTAAQGATRASHRAAPPSHNGMLASWRTWPIWLRLGSWLPSIPIKPGGTPLCAPTTSSPRWPKG